MRGPIDYIIVGFEGNKFDGSILKALGDAIDSGVVGLVALAVISKDRAGNVTEFDITESEDGYVAEFAKRYSKKAERVKYEDINEMASVLENNTSAGLLVIEQLWAKPLKKALLDANGVLVAEGRIHPEAAVELDKKGEK
jgi:hypothetical protein